MNLSSNVIVNSVSPIEELKPLKNKKRRTKKVKKNVYSKFKSQQLLWLIPIAFLGGITLFIVGIFLSNLTLWITGLIVYSVMNLFFYTVLFALRHAASKAETPFEGYITIYLILLIELINLILALTFVILGLSFAIPVFWIVGLSILGFLALSIILFFILTKLL